MSEFLSSYGLWIFLGGIFVAMHMFGMGCCGGHSREPEPRRKEEGETLTSPTASGEGKAAEAPKPVAGRCH